ncbi:PaaI family thioesterase [Methylobacterium nodulans]|uniref:Thioesterase superfamily protein n=1 Tax=Methylobacterium nodulans (strain LMG 21967 / CNCM I-2342 / ORS 2060) TaxID=460265 RepID=B8IK05_METNO|nr:PaaI family thioesterase [Methylobacterium nodulans]ACL60018.1 thioesterase superfamily protein [Methylobacterium nodulans ORS 2060]
MSELDPAAGWHPFTDPGFVDLVGPIFVREGDGPAAYAFRAEPKHANLIGVVQGGMLMTFADRALGVTAMAAADGANCVTVQFEMQFIAAVRMGEVVTLAPQVVQRTGTLVFLRGDLMSGGRVAASCTGVWKILRRRPEVPA